MVVSFLGGRSEYSIDNKTWFEYLEPIKIEEEGIYTIYYRSTDWFGNVEEIQSVTFTIVTEASTPITTLEATSADGAGILVTLSATDDTSGVDYTEYSLDLGDTWLTYTDPFVLSGETEYTVWYRSVSNDGITEEIRMETLDTESFDGSETTSSPRSISRGNSVTAQLVQSSPSPQVLGVATSEDLSDEEIMAMQRQIIELLQELIDLLELKYGI